MKLIPTILCGGAGSRLWPVSRELHPKPFIRLADGESLLQKAFKRGALLPSATEVLTVTNRELVFKTKDEYQEINAANIPASYILEPFGRNTAAAIAAASIYVGKKYGDDAILLVLPADHLISDQDAFALAVDKATKLAEAGRLVTFGISPSSPETGYGYIEANGTEVSRFVEKPTLDKAQEYLAAGNYFWNSGMFCFTAGTMLREMERYCPDILSCTAACMEQSGAVHGKGLLQVELDKEYFGRVASNSIDYAVMELSDKVAVVACDIGWSDIGSWSALGDLTMADAQGNRVDGDALLHDVRNCYIQSRERLVGAVGLDDIVIVDTPDALLVAHKSRSQEVGRLYNELKSQGHGAYKLHRTVHRPWGTYTVLEEGNRFQIKRIVVKPGESLSLQLHHHRSEHWVVVNGMAKVTNGEKEFFVGTNESTYIPAGYKHRLENPGVLDLVMIEVQSGEYLGEDDIVRFEDTYGRA